MPSATSYDPKMSTREARARYFADNEFGEDGGYSKAWVTLLQLGPLPLGFPNTDARRLAVRYHDLHHLVTGYDTDLLGEGEIAAWELGGGCGKHHAAWALNTAALSFGLVLDRERTRRAFARGMNSRNLYDRAYSEAWLDEELGVLRERLGVDEASTELSPAQTRRYRFFVALSVLLAGGLLALTLAFMGAAIAGLLALV